MENCKKALDIPHDTWYYITTVRKKQKADRPERKIKMENKTWYAVLKNNEDNDWGYGSDNYDEAVEMAKKFRALGYEDAYIAVIADGDDPICTDEIREF